MEVADLLLLLGIYFGSVQAQSSNVLNNSCQGSGLVLFSADHNVLQNSWKISPWQYCLIVYLQASLSQQLGSWETEGIQGCKHEQLGSQSFVTSSIFCGVKHNTCSPLGDVLPLHKRHCPHCLRHVMSQRLWPSSYITTTTWPHVGPVEQGLQGLVLLRVLPAGELCIGQGDALLFCTE